MAVFSFQYYKKLHATIRDESKAYLQEVSKRVGSNIDRIISDNYGVLATIATMLETAEVNSIKDIQDVLQKQQDSWNYASIMLIDDSGKAYGLDNEEIFLSINNAMRKDILNKKASMSTTQLVNNQEYILFSVPIEGMTIDGKEIIALAASYAPTSFDQVLSMTSFNEQAYSQIVNKSGSMVTRPTSEYAISSGYNIFSTLESAHLDNGQSLEHVKADIVSDYADQISFTLNGAHSYMVYTPIQPDEWYLLTFVPFHAVNAKSDALLQTTLLICGIITLTFAALLATLIYIFGSSKRKLEQIAYVDSVTGGNTLEKFYDLAADALTVNSRENYALVYTNIEKFKVLNEQIGRENCDKLLSRFYSYINSVLEEHEYMGRLTADNFCILLKYTEEDELLGRFTRWYDDAERYAQSGQLPWSLPVTAFGVYIIDNHAIAIPQMIDRAKLALRDSRWIVDNKLRYGLYDEALSKQLFREKQLEDIMEKSLLANEFEVYLQPKYHLPEEKILGAEALVRWITSDEGMIFPDEFIPLFEKNGFIVRLDLWVFEQVCRTISGWIKEGLTPIKVSVNCSRVHFKNPAFLTPYKNIASNYSIDRSLIEIELTESVVLENTDELNKIIHEIRDAGFGCSMDDFGSGYSSLNLIQNIPVDTLKLDKIFFLGNSSPETRTEAVIKSIVLMAKALSMETVAEGVEYPEQVAMLKRVGCDYVQGYVFARPMKIVDFEKLAFNKHDV